MPALPLSEAMQHAHEAISGGNYRSAVETCRRVLGQFPDYAAAYQLLGEASLEQREVDEAESAFQEALRRDPQNPAAYLGLGVIAEEHADPERSLAYFQAAWEMYPQRTDLRDHVVRLSQQLYGLDGRLQLTRAALASLHYLSGRWSRAVAESAAVLAEHPTRVDVRLRLAEALWRRGEDTRALAVCRQVLDQAPQAVGALLIMAAVERRQGNEAEAAKLRDGARSIDPLGARAAELLAAVLPDDVAFFAPAEAPILEERAPAAAEPEMRRIAPAPDFSAPLSAEPAPTPAPAEAEIPASEPAPVAEAPAMSLATDAELAAARPPAPSAPGEFADVLQLLENTGLEPFQAPDFATGPAATNGTAPKPAADAAQDLSALLEMPSDADLDAARPAADDMRGYTSLLRSLEDTGLEPFSVEGEVVAEAPAMEPAPAPTMAAADIPIAETPAPPVIAEAPAVAEAPEPPVAAAPEVTAPATAAPEAGEPAVASVPGVAVDWDAIDDEIRNAIPGDMPHGYTEQLRSLDASGVEPFSFEGEEIPFFQRTRGAKQSAPEPAAPQPSAAEVVAEQPAASLAAEDEMLDLGSLERLDEEPVERVAAEVPVAPEPAAPAPALAAAAEDVVVETTPVVAAEPVVLAEPAVAEAAAMAAALEVDQPAAIGQPAVEQVAADSMVARGGEPPAASEGSVRTAFDRLGVGTDLFERARAAKSGLVAAGRVGGGRSLVGEERALEPEPEPAVAALVVQEPAPVALDDPDARLELAETLVESGQIEGALEEFRWIYRNKPEYGERLIPGLTRVANSGEGAATAHRLLGAIYRRRGDVQLATRHYALSLGQERQPTAGRRG